MRSQLGHPCHAGMRNVQAGSMLARAIARELGRMGAHAQIHVLAWRRRRIPATKIAATPIHAHSRRAGARIRTQARTYASTCTNSRTDMKKTSYSCNGQRCCGARPRPEHGHGTARSGQGAECRFRVIRDIAHTCCRCGCCCRCRLLMLMLM